MIHYLGISLCIDITMVFSLGILDCLVFSLGIAMCVEQVDTWYWYYLVTSYLGISITMAQVSSLLT